MHILHILRNLPSEVKVHSSRDAYFQANGRVDLWLYLDVLWSRLRYGATLKDYFLYCFYELNARGRREFITDRRRKKWCDANRDMEMFRILNDKEETLERFGRYVARDWCGARLHNSDADYANFAARHKRMIVKPLHGFAGKGVRIVEPRSADEIKAICQSEEAVVEELIEQHADLAALYPRAINTLRVVTMNRRVIGAALRMGAGGNCVDNTSAGGVYAGIDVDSGIVVSRALNHLGERFVRHPDTGVVIPGFKIPYWRESLSLIEDAVPLTVGVPLIGWDIAITASGPTLVEVNTHPGMWTMQAPLGIGYKRLIFDVQPELLQRP